MDCISKVENSLSTLVNPQVDDALKSQKLNKATGYLVLGIITTISAVALVALGITLIAFNSPLGFIPLAAAVPVLWLGHTIIMIAYNYKKIANNSASYWNEATKFADEAKIAIDLTKGTLFCGAIMKDPKIQQAYQDLAKARLKLAHTIEQGRQAVQNQQEEADILREKLALDAAQAQERRDQITQKLNEQKLQWENDRQKEAVKNEEKAVEEIKNIIAEKEEQIADAGEKHKGAHRAIKKAIVMLAKDRCMLFNLSKEAKERVLSPYTKKYPELKELLNQ